MCIKYVLLLFCSPPKHWGLVMLTFYIYLAAFNIVTTRKQTPPVAAVPRVSLTGG